MCMSEYRVGGSSSGTPEFLSLAFPTAQKSCASTATTELSAVSLKDLKTCF